MLRTLVQVVLIGIAYLAIGNADAGGADVLAQRAESRTTTIRVKAETIARTDRLTLGDIAEIKGSPSGVEQLKAISLGYAPDVGVVRQIPEEKIALTIAAAGFPQGSI